MTSFGVSLPADTTKGRMSLAGPLCGPFVTAWVIPSQVNKENFR